MLYWNKLTISMGCLALSFSLFANSFPHGCEPSGYGFQQNNLILNDSGRQSFYMIQNKTNKPVIIERIQAANMFMSPKLHCNINALNWAAFASDIRDMNFKCYFAEGDNTQLINCADALDVCQYPRVRFALSNMGNYWVSSNKPQGQVIRDAAAKGIYLKW